MKYEVVSVHDRAADAYGRPIYVAALGQAIRSFHDEINRVGPDNTMNTHPEDYDLYHLGQFNDETGQHSNLEQPHQLAIGKQCKITIN